MLFLAWFHNFSCKEIHLRVEANAWLLTLLVPRLPLLAGNGMLDEEA